MKDMSFNEVNVINQVTRLAAEYQRLRYEKELLRMENERLTWILDKERTPTNPEKQDKLPVRLIEDMKQVYFDSKIKPYWVSVRNSRYHDGFETFEEWRKRTSDDARVPDYLSKEQAYDVFFWQFKALYEDELKKAEESAKKEDDE